MDKIIKKNKMLQPIGKYTIVRTVEITYFYNDKMHEKSKTWYDVCLDNGDGDIVYSCDKLNEARKWAKEN